MTGTFLLGLIKLYEPIVSTGSVLPGRAGCLGPTRTVVSAEWERTAWASGGVEFARLRLSPG